MSFLGFLYWVILVVCILVGVGSTNPNWPYSRYWGWPFVALAIIVGLTLYTSGFHGIR